MSVRWSRALSAKCLWNWGRPSRRATSWPISTAAKLERRNCNSSRTSCSWHRQRGRASGTAQSTRTRLHSSTCFGEGQALDEIETAFEDRPVGTYREQLVSALARLKRAKADFERIRELGASSVIPEKEVIRARAEHEAAEATYRALMEQIRFDAQQQALDAQQELQAAEAAVAISRSHLLILGYSEEDIDSMDPIAEAERVAYYPVRSPIDRHGDRQEMLRCRNTLTTKRS